jgi:serine/threonine-protein kinase
VVKAGDTIAHYVIEGTLGEGGMGQVFLALDQRLHRRVALKVLADDAEHSSRDSGARLLREARSAASLTHPNVVGIFEVGEHEGRIYLAMEHVVGRTLREHVGDPAVPWSRKLRWLVEVARALSAAHRAGLVHRDVKPENVMVRDEDGLVKVLDFGIARRAGGGDVDPTARTEAASLSTLTGKGQVIGTPMYMAPEQIKGGAPDARTDQFAWGVLAFELLAGRRPWPDRSDLLAAVAAILTEAPAPLRALAPEIPESVESVIMRALSRTPEERFATMDDVVDVLEPFASRSGRGASLPSPLGAAPRLEAARTAREGRGTRPVEEPSKAADAAPPPKLAATTRRSMVTERSPGAPPPPPRPFWSLRRFAVLATLAAVGVVGLGVRAYRGRSPARPVVSASPPASALSSAVPLSDDAQALRMYGEAVQLWRDGNMGKARKAFEDVIARDPNMAAAHLRFALFLYGDEPEAALKHFQSAYANRSKLPAIDAALLGAMEPAVRPDPNLEEAEKRAVALRDEYPRSAEVAYWLGLVHHDRSNFEKASEAYQQAIDLDRSFVPPRKARAQVLAQLGDVRGAISAYGECIDASPTASTCLAGRLELLADRGDCAQMEKDARRWQLLEPDEYTADYALAVSLVGERVALPAVEEALLHQWRDMPDTQRRQGELVDRADLALLAGDFALAERRTREWEQALPKDADLSERKGPYAQLASILFETGDVQGAGRIAEDFVQRMKGWTSARGEDPTLPFLEYLYRSGRIDKAELDKRRREWLTRAEEKETATERRRMAPFRWAMAYAGFAETMEEAKEALATQEDFLPLPPESRQSIAFGANVGKAYALAGRFEEALPFLERATRSCRALEQPQLHTRAHYFLGLAYEGLGRIEDARRAYGVVVERWGGAKPRSITAERAQERLKQLPKP